MRSSINPFFTRASEYVGSDGRFIKLFSPEILFLFKDYPVLNTVNIFRSSPGGGKTTLLKLFTPRVLAEIIKNQKHESCKDIFKILKELEVVDDKGALISSSLISFNNEYSSLEYLEINDVQKERLFFTLLNIRVILSVLQSLCITKNLQFPEDLDKITIKNSKGVIIPQNLVKLKTGLDYYDWASQLEEQICNQMDSFNFDLRVLEGSNDLYSLELFEKQNLFYENEPIIENIIVMLDDVHDLSKKQRYNLLNKIINKRPPVTTWIAERLKALTMDEILEGTTAGRDKNTIYLEKYWSSRNFEKFARSVADRRVSIVFEDEITNFNSFLSSTFKNETQGIIRDEKINVENRIRSNFASNRYKQWLTSAECEYDTEYDALVSWRSLEILLVRDENKKQKTLEFDELQEVELEEQEGPDVKNAGRLFLNIEKEIPYYFGFSTICKLSSSNIEQFLTIAGQLFEDILSKKVYKKLKKEYSLNITPERQEEIILKACRAKWNDLKEKVPNFDKISTFLDSLGAFCYSQTYVPNAWNSPGLNGIAITMRDRAFLKDTVLKNPQHPLYELANCLVTCISYNLLDYTLNYKCQGKIYMVFYLNRIYCAKYKLPLDNGKFKERKLTDLASWMEKVYSPSKNKNLWEQD
jgi:hypothetical protein